VAYLPLYSPQRNPVVNVWRRGRGGWMPRRHFGGVEELRGAVAAAIARPQPPLGRGVLQSLCMNT
jgi:putative transposase